MGKTSPLKGFFSGRCFVRNNIDNFVDLPTTKLSQTLNNHV
jgi:hypothetical protein